MSVPELIAFVKQELDTDEERQARIALAEDGGSGIVPDKAHSGHTLDLSHKNIEALPVQVVALIKERVARCVLVGRWREGCSADGDTDLHYHTICAFTYRWRLPNATSCAISIYAGTS